MKSARKKKPIQSNSSKNEGEPVLMCNSVDTEKHFTMASFQEAMMAFNSHTPKADLNTQGAKTTSLKTFKILLNILAFFQY